MKVRFSRRALAQIVEIHANIAAHDPRAARAAIGRIESAAALLARHPAIGRRTDHAAIRVFSLRPYPWLMFYAADIGRDELTVLRIRHMARKTNWRLGR